MDRALPPDVMAAVRAPFEAFGGVWTDAPVLQPLSLLLDLVGEAVRSRLFVVSGGSCEQVLRPDFTIPITTLHIASRAPDGQYLYEGKAFRAPGSQAEPEAEFLQIGVERFGARGDPAEEDASIAALAFAAVRGGGRKDLTIQLGDVSLFRDFLTALNLPSAVSMRLVQLFADPKALRAELDASVRPDRTGQALRTASGGGRLAGLLATLPEAEASLVLEELWTLAGIRPVGGRSAAEITHRIVLRATAAKSPGLTPAEADLIRRYLAISAPPRIALEQAESLAAEGGGDLSAAASHWTRRLTALVRAGTPEELMTLSTAFARPFGYYDGLFFEIRSSALGPEAPLAAGGRYDGLPARLGGQAGAVGCMVRPARAAFGGEA